MKAKKITLISSFALALFLFITSFTNSSSKPQNDISGWYADGVKVEKMDCFSFQDLKIAVPFKPEWNQYEFIKIRIDYTSVKGSSIFNYMFEKVIPVKSINSHVKSGFLIYQLFGKENASIDLKNFSDEHEISTAEGVLLKTKMKFETAFKAGKPAPEMKLVAKIYGLGFAYEKEEFNTGCNCIIKKKRYTPTSLDKDYTLLVSGRVTAKVRDIENGVGLDSTCTYSGTKVDFNNLK